MEGGSCRCNTGYTGSKCGYKMLMDIDYHGTDLPDFNPWEHRCADASCCANYCDAYPNGNCKLWVWWDTTKGGGCFLKSAVPSIVEDEAHLVTGVPTDNNCMRGRCAVLIS